MNQIAITMIKLMKTDCVSHIWYGDIAIIEKCAMLCNIQHVHPKKRIQIVLNSLDRSDLFVKSYIISDISGKKRKYRCFTIKNHSSTDVSN